MASNRDPALTPAPLASAAASAVGEVVGHRGVRRVGGEQLPQVLLEIGAHRDSSTGFSYGWASRSDARARDAVARTVLGRMLSRSAIEASSRSA